MDTVEKASVAPGVVSGALSSVVAGTVYVLLLHEPGSLFYPFAALVFFGGPLVGGTIGASRSHEQKCRAFLVSAGTVFAAALVLFSVTHAVLPQFDRTSVELPESCSCFAGSHPPSVLACELPGTRTGVLVADSDLTPVVAMIDRSRAPYPSTVRVVNKSDNRTLRRLDFPDDTISAAVDGGTVFLYNDKLGYFLDARTGDPVRKFLIIDNFGGLSSRERPLLPGAPGERRHLETTAVISLWSADGTVCSRSRLAMNGVAYGCFVDGVTGEIVEV